MRRALVLPAVGPQVFVLWPDDGTWYKGQVEECDVAAGKASIYYEETEEQVGRRWRRGAAPPRRRA